MKFLTFLTLFFVAIICTVASPVQQLHTSSRLTADEIAELRARVRGCNANVCFAIDGSGSINATEYRAELNFVLDVISIITVDDAVELAAVQYGIASSPISPLTIDFENIILAVQTEEQLRAPATFVSAGINYCFSQLFRRLGEANKIVLLGDGRSNIGASAIERAQTFRDFANGEVCTVGAGFKDTTELLAIAGGDPDRVFSVDNFIDALRLQAVVEGVVAGICDIDPAIVATPSD